MRVYEKHPSADAYRVGASFTPYAIVAKDKRLTDAELAAEFEAARCDYLLSHPTGHFWAPLEETWPRDHASAGRRATTLLRFATLPHYDEES